MSYIYIYIRARARARTHARTYARTHVRTYVRTFENELLPPAAFQQRQHVDAVQCRKYFSGLISMLVFDMV